MTIVYQPVVRNFQKTPPINSSTNDHYTPEGVRVSVPIYVDLTTAQRKELLNGIREACSVSVSTEVKSASGLSVQESSSAQPSVESYVGMTLDCLRGVLFQRGGLPLDLVLKLQSASGITYVTEKTIAAAVKAKQAVVKTFISDYPYEATTPSS